MLTSDQWSLTHPSAASMKLSVGHLSLSGIDNKQICSSPIVSALNKLGNHLILIDPEDSDQLSNSLIVHSTAACNCSYL